MTAAINTEGTASPTSGGSAVTLADVTTAGTYVLQVDLTNMAAGDYVIIRIRQRVNTSAGALGSTTTVAYQVAFANAQVALCAISPPILVPLGARFELEQPSGTSRTFPWALVTP